MIDDKTATTPKNASIKQYRKAKFKMLERDFCITLTNDEKLHAYSLTTEAALDQFAIGILNKRWG